MNEDKKVTLFRKRTIDITTGKQYVNTNAFVKLSFIFDKQEVLNEAMNNIVSTNLDDVNLFVHKMISYESSRVAPNAKKHKHKYLVVLDIMLNNHYDSNSIHTICKKIANKYDNLPYFAYTYEDGKALMLRMLFCERHYYKKGKKHQKTYKYGKFIDATTGKTLKNKTKNSITVYEKGEKVVSIENFSKKTKIFIVLTNASLRAFSDDLKNYLYDIYKEFGAEIIEESPINHIRYKESKRVFKPVIHKWNNTFDTIQEFILNIKKELNNKFETAYDMEITNVITVINQEIKNKEFSLAKKIYHIDDGKDYVNNYKNYISYFDDKYDSNYMRLNELNLSDYKERGILINALRDYQDCQLPIITEAYIFHVKQIIKNFVKSNRLPEFCLSFCRF